MRLALYQPDIPQNAGTILRLAACMGVGVDVIEPCGFIWDDKRLRRAGMDYLDRVDLARHRSWERFLETRAAGRLVLLTTQGAVRYTEARFSASDTLLLGRESAGVPLDVHQRADLRVRIPLTPVARSLNVALAAAMVLGEALRQTDLLPEDPA
tara:strand:- start:1084 stop:1545 length:462 start_codon:yes stop_codon:yes gene_type:complete